MAEPENPLIPIQEKVARVHAQLLSFFRNVLMKIKPMMRSLQGFLVNVKKAAKDIALAVGKAAVDSVIKTGEALLQLVSFVEKQVVEGIKLAIKTLAFIRKAASNPEKAFKTVKAMVARVAKLFRAIVTSVFELMVKINPIEIALNLIDTMKTMLQMVFRWISQVGPISSNIKKAKSLIKKAAKLLKAEGKQVTDLVKQVNKLKPA